MGLDLALDARFDQTIDLGPYEGVLQTLATIFPGLTPLADDNGNGLSNYEDYAAGFDPASPVSPLQVDPTLTELGGALFLSHTVRRTVDDLDLAYEVSDDLIN